MRANFLWQQMVRDVAFEPRVEFLPPNSDLSENKKLLADLLRVVASSERRLLGLSEIVAACRSVFGFPKNTV